jgi:hypothetical protein
MRSYLANTILPLIPENVRNGIKEVRKFTCSEVPDDTASAHYIQVPNQETIDKLCIPSAQELFGNSANEFEGIDFVIDTDHRKKKKAGGSNYINYFMRSTAEYPYSGKTTFARCNSSGVYGTETASTASGVVIEFCT